MKIKRLIFILIFLLFMAFVYLVVYGTEVPTNKEEAVKIIQNKMNDPKNQTKNPCIVNFSSEEKDYFQVEVRERHGDKICPGAIKNFTLIGMFRINKKTGEISIYDVINDRFVNFEESISK